MTLMTPVMERWLRVLSWCLGGLVIFVGAYTLFAFWGANAELLGKRNAGLAIFFAITGGWALIACLFLAPASGLLALVSWLARKGAPLAWLLASAASALPFLLLR
jgi:hypothetical protein